MSEVGHVWLVGAGPGDPALVTEGGLAALRRAEVVLYDRLAPPELLDACPAEAERIDAGKAPGRVAMSQEEINAALVEHARAGKRVVRLKGGDPFVFGRGGEELETLAAAGIEATVLPGVTSAIAGLATAGIPITHRGVAVSFAVVTGHEDPAKPAAQARWVELATAVDTLVVLMGVGRLEAIAGALIAGGRPAETPSALVVEATTPRQRVVEAPLGEIAAAAEAGGVHPPALLVVGEVVALRARIAPALRRPLAGRRVLVTRTRRQASRLAEALRAEGAEPLLLPAIEIRRRAVPEYVQRSLAGLRTRSYAWVVFTSENAVEAYFELLREAGEDARLFAGAQLVAVGGATSRALAARGLAADLVPARASGEGVAEALAELGVSNATGAAAARRAGAAGARAWAARRGGGGRRGHALPRGAAGRPTGRGAGGAARGRGRRGDVHLVVDRAQSRDAARRQPRAAARRRRRLHRAGDGGGGARGGLAAGRGGGGAVGRRASGGAAKICTRPRARRGGRPMIVETQRKGFARTRRLRRSEALRGLVRETRLDPASFVYPLFVTEGAGVREPIASMPGQSRLSTDQLAGEAAELRELGLRAVMLFGVPSQKDAEGSGAWLHDGIAQAGVAALKEPDPSLAVIADICLCEYTDHGHCGPLNARGEVDNDGALELLARTAVSLAEAGVDMVAPSDMMDGRVGAIREALDESGFAELPIMAYSAKYASAFYGPFREAADSAPQFGDRRGYQMDPPNVREAVREAAIDVEEQADIVMVKPALAYLDVVRAVRESTALPLAAYNVSGEYAMVKAAAAQGWLDERGVVLEILTGLRRAGADILISYHAKEAARWLREA